MNRAEVVQYVDELPLYGVIPRGDVKLAVMVARRRARSRAYAFMDAMHLAGTGFLQVNEGWEPLWPHEAEQAFESLTVGDGGA
jgi:hypothetical protein